MLKRILLLCLVVISSVAIYAQQLKKISGTVSDASTGELLIGATIVDPASKAGTTADLDGKYALEISGNKIAVSYVGYATREIAVNQSGVYDVKLTSSIDLDEVVVVGYGVQRKSDLTGAISSISSKDIKNQAAANVSNLLAGKAAGVHVAASSGQPGSSAVVRIRGLGTVNDNNPLYVVDGQFMDNINSLNPADIDRIEILKDASSLAIYGSRGSNGVIIVSTKKGTSGEAIINLDVSVGIKDAYKSVKMMNSDQYYDFIMQSYKQDATWDNTGATGNAYNFTQLYKRGYDTNWWDETTQTGFTQNYNVSVRKGTETSRTALSMGYYSEEGTIITTNFDRISARFSQEYDIKNIVTVGATMNLASMKQRNADALPQFIQLIDAEPFTPVINPLVDPSSENYQYNKYSPTEWTFNRNPVATLEIPNRYNKLFNVYGNIFANVKLYDGLTYRFQYSLEKNNDKSHNFTPLWTNTFTEYVITDKEGKTSNKKASLSQGSGSVLNQTFENRINYNKTFGKHLIDIMGAITYETKDNESFNAYGAGAIGNDDVYEVLGSHPDNHSVGGSRTTMSMMSYLGRLNYSFDNKYLLTASFRTDGSSVFAKENRWGYFPSVSLGWRITNEQFFQNLQTDSWLDDAKIRLGWGRNGNARIDQNAALTLVSSGKSDKWSFDGKNLVNGYYLNYTGNKFVKWETSEQANVGLDLTLFNKSRNTLSITMDYYVKTTRDVLLPFSLPSFGGFTNSPYMNAGKIGNTGFEFSANYTNTAVKDFTFDFGLNLSTYKTKIKSLNVGEYGLDYLGGNNGRSYINGPFNKFWGLKHLGIFQTQEEIDNYVDAKGNKIQPNAEPGDFKFANLNNDNPLNDEDATFIGDPNPDLIFGFNLGVQYKAVDLSMSFQGTLGNDVWNAPKGALAASGFQNAIAEAYTNAWTKEGDNAKYPRMTNTNPNSNFRASSFYVEDGSYMRLQSLQIGFTVPPKIAKQTKVFSSLRIYASAQNLFTLTKYSGLDPDLGSNSPLSMGVDALRYPSPRTFMFGLNAEF